MQKFSAVLTVIILIISVIAIGLIAVFDRIVIFKATDLVKDNLWPAGIAGFVFLVLFLTGIITNLTRTEGTFFGNGYIQLAVLELLLCTAGLAWYRYYLQEPGRIVLRLTPESTAEKVYLSRQFRSAGSTVVDTVAAPGVLDNLPYGKYTFETINEDILYFKTDISLEPAETETLFVPANLNTKILTVGSEPPGAEIWLNGLQASLTPDNFDIMAGDTVVVELKLKGYESRIDTLVLNADLDMGVVPLRKLYILWISPQYDYTVYLIYDEEGEIVFSGSGSRRLELAEGRYRLAYEIGEGQYSSKSFQLKYNLTVTIP